MAIPTFGVRPNRFDPYKNFKFRIRWNGKVVAGMSRVTGLEQSTHIGSGVNPGIRTFEPITLDRGITYDAEFENWAKKVWHPAGNAAISLKNFRKDIIIEWLNEQGTVAKVYRLYNCWVSAYQALPDLDAGSNAVAIEHLVLQHEGWEPG
jgi:phage tail-like protein